MSNWAVLQVSYAFNRTFSDSTENRVVDYLFVFVTPSVKSYFQPTPLELQPSVLVKC